MQGSLFNLEDPTGRVTSIDKRISNTQGAPTPEEFRSQINDIIFDINVLINDSINKYKQGTISPGLFSDLQKLTTAVNNNINNYRMNNAGSEPTSDIENFIILSKK